MGAEEANRRGSILSVAFEPVTVADGVHLIATQGNGVAVEQEEGLVLLDAGPGGELTERAIADVRRLSDRPVRAIVYSHGHVGYNAGVAQWRSHATGRGERQPLTVGQRNVLRRFERYERTRGLQLMLNSWQFPRTSREALEAGLSIPPPEVTFDDSYLLDDAERPVEVFAAPSETDDTVGLWLPRQRILYGGPAVINGFPNIGTPQRIQRFTTRWIATLGKMCSRGAGTLVPEFGPVVAGEEAVRERLVSTIDALQWLVDEVISRLNRGMTDVEIIHDLPDPGPLFDHPHLRANYGSPDYVVRDLAREHFGWWMSRNPTDLHPAHPDRVGAAVLDAVDPERVLERARALISEGDDRLALHVLDLVALAPGDAPVIEEARRLKAQCCDRLAGECTIFVSRSLYRGSARLLRSGRTRWSQAPDGLDLLDG